MCIHAEQKCPDNEVRRPTIRVVTTTSSKGNVMDFNSLLEPMDQAYALFSAKKRLGGILKKEAFLNRNIRSLYPTDKKTLWLRNWQFQRGR